MWEGGGKYKEAKESVTDPQRWEQPLRAGTWVPQIGLCPQTGCVPVKTLIRKRMEREEPDQ